MDGSILAAKMGSSIASISKMVRLFIKRSGWARWKAVFRVVDGRIYIGTEQGDLYCLDMSDGSTIWKARIGADSDSTPAVANGLRLHGGRGWLRLLLQAEQMASLVWKFKADGGLSRNYKERSGFWASPIVTNDRDLHRFEQWLHVLPDRGQRRGRLAAPGARANLGHFAGGRWTRRLRRQGRVDVYALG